MSKVNVFRATLAAVIVGGIFAYSISAVEVLTASSFFGFFAFSVASGAIAFFAISSPFGTRTHIQVFGRQQRYLFPASDIPIKAAMLVLSVVILCCALSFGFYVYGY